LEDWAKNAQQQQPEHYLYLQVHKYLKRVLVHYMATWPKS
jgi:hypothetical protein